MAERKPSPRRENSLRFAIFLLVLLTGSLDREAAAQSVQNDRVDVSAPTRISVSAGSVLPVDLVAPVAPMSVQGIDAEPRGSAARLASAAVQEAAPASPAVAKTAASGQGTVGPFAPLGNVLGQAVVGVYRDGGNYQPAALDASADSLKADSSRPFDLSSAGSASVDSPVSATGGSRGAGLPGLRRAGQRGLEGARRALSLLPGNPVESKKAAGVYRWAGLGLAATAVILHPGAAASTLGFASDYAYKFANYAGVLFPVFQIFQIFKNRSADISASTLLTGILASLLLVVNFSHLGNGLAAIQNLVGVLAFGVIAVQRYWYSRRPASGAAPRGKYAAIAASVRNGLAAVRNRLVAALGEKHASFAVAAAKTLLAVAAVGGLTFAVGAGMLAIMPAFPLPGAVMVAFQVLAELGFAYLMMPQYLKIQHEKSVGDSSRGMALAYWACVVAAGLWALNMCVTLPAAAASVTVLPVLAFAAATLAVSSALVRWIGSYSWKFIPQKLTLGRWTLSRETMVNAASLVALTPVLFGSVFIAAPMFLGHFMAIPAGSKYGVYLLYLVGNILAVLVTNATLRAFRLHASKK